MREIIFLNYGSTSNYISTHFWNLNDELFKVEDKYNLDQSIIYNDNNQPRNMVFDYSENIRPYYLQNEKLTKKEKTIIEDDVKVKNIDLKINTIELDSLDSNKFLDMINDVNLEDKNMNGLGSNPYEEIVNTKKNEDYLPPQDIYKLPEDKIYDYLNLPNTIKNWNDFLQPKFPNKAFNEIKSVDIDLTTANSYLKGIDFFTMEKFNHNYYLYEDNFRKYLEDCDKLEVLHTNVDFNSFWGGVSNKLLENFNEQIPKVQKVFYGTDQHSSFFNQKDGSFDVEKFVNYIWFFTDLNEFSNANSIFMPIYKNQNPSFIKEIFGNAKPNTPAYEYFYTSLCGLNLQNLYMPLRSKYFASIGNLSNLSPNSSINFFESDTVFALENIVKYSHLHKELKNNGIMFNLSRNIKDKTFCWKSLLDNSFKYNKYNSTIIHGYNDKLLVLGEKIEGFLMKHSSINYTAIDNLEIPLCYPRKINIPKGKEVFLSSASSMCNYRPFWEFPLKTLKYFPQYFKDYDMEVKKYLVTFDLGKYVEYREKIEEIHEIFEANDGFYEYYNPGFSFEYDKEYDDDIDI